MIYWVSLWNECQLNGLSMARFHPIALFLRPWGKGLAAAVKIVETRDSKYPEDLAAPWSYWPKYLWPRVSFSILFYKALSINHEVACLLCQHSVWTLPELTCTNCDSWGLGKGEITSQCTSSILNWSISPHQNRSLTQIPLIFQYCTRGI